MTRERFEQLLDELDGTSLQTLKQKNAKYSSLEDALHNFNEGSDIGGCTPAQAAWFYAVKHLIALRDKILKNDFSDREDFLEKTQDIINYLRFIWCLGNEELDKQFNNITLDDVRKAKLHDAYLAACVNSSTSANSEHIEAYNTKTF